MISDNLIIKQELSLVTHQKEKLLQKYLKLQKDKTILSSLKTKVVTSNNLMINSNENLKMFAHALKKREENINLEKKRLAEVTIFLGDPEINK